LAIPSALSSLRLQVGLRQDLAHYLGNRECTHLLNPHSNRRTIRAWLRGDTLSTHLDEEQFARYFGVTYSSHLYFADYKTLLKVLHNCPWTLRKTFLGGDNRALAEKFQPYLESGRIADVSIRWIDDALGYGLFANSDLPVGTFVGEFTGELRQLSHWRPQYNAYCFHYPTSCFSWNYMVIDAAVRGNETRFINHSDTPNLQPHWLCNQSLLHLVFFTNQPVLAGMQLTYNYGQDFWRHRQKIAIQERQWVAEVAELEPVAENARHSS
jgi:hypothetical protein